MCPTLKLGTGEPGNRDPGSQVRYQDTGYCFFSFPPGFVFGSSAQASFFSLRRSPTSVQLGGGQKPIKQAGAIDLNTNALHYLYATLLRAIAEKTNDPPKTKEHPVLDPLGRQNTCPGQAQPAREGKS